MKKCFGLFLGWIAVLIAGTSLSFGQAISVNGGSIQGSITDSTGAVVPGANIVITGTSTGFTKTLTADQSGFYSVGPLNPGPYTVNVTAPGFQKLAVQTVVRTGTATSGNFKLTIGESTQTVEVNAGALQVNTEQAGVSDVITKQQIDSLPVNGRNFLDLAQIEPGVILQSGETFDPTKAGYSAISVGGVSGRTTRILLDGQDITDETVGTTIFNVSQGAIHEFQLNRSTQDVSGDVTSTGQVLVSTNSGTNNVHGQLFYNFQDHRALFARALNGQDPQFQRNQFGGSVGFPILRDRLFLFANAERIKQDSSSVSPVSTGSGAHFGAIAAANPFIPSPYRETYSTARADYNGPLGGHYFARINYNVNAVSSNYGLGYALYANRDNTPGVAGGADFQLGRFTHSFRVSYEKFHNLISDETAGNTSLYQTVPGVFVRFSTQGLISGPNYLAPQGTFQSDKQFRYDGSWTKGKHNIRYGYSLNRILGGGYAAFFGLSPYQTETEATLLTGVVDATRNPYGFGCKGVVGAAPCPNDPANGYRTSTAEIGNGQGSFTEKPAFGLPGSGVEDWREGAYVSDNWKVTPEFNLIAGVRWSVDTDRANQDIANPLCSDVDTANVTAPCTGSASLLGQWNPSLAAAHSHQPYANFGPQIGFNYSPRNGKTSIRGGFGIFYESDVFNNTTNARNALIKTGAFFSRQVFCSGGGKYSVTFPDGSVVNSVNGVSINQLCFSPVAISGPAFLQLQKDYQANTRANSQLANGSYVGETLQGDGIYGTPYRTPYSEQWNGGIQQELFKGSVLSIDYVHNSTLKVGQTVDQNHVGAARYLNTTAATNAIIATTQAAGCSGGASAAAINCAIAAHKGLGDFANNGLDSGSQYLGGTPASYNGLTTATGAAFPGANPLLGTGRFILPIGRSGYDALQVVYKQVTAHPAPGIDQMNFQASYSLSRIVTSSAGGADQFFSSGSWDNDDPNRYIGRTSLDHTNQLSMGGAFTLKYGPTIGLIGHFYSAPPQTLTLDSSTATGSIFQTDITGDGTIGDIAPNTDPGDYMHRIKAKQLAGYISSFNATQAGRLTPAGQALINAGLFSPAQLNAIGAVIQPIAQLPQAQALNNPAFRSLDVNFSYPVRLNRFHEGMSLEPSIVFYNVANFSNYNAALPTGVLLNQANANGPINNSSNYLTGPNSYDVLNSNRDQRGSGTFDQGAARSTEFQLKFNF